MTLPVRRLAQTDDRSKFESGDVDLDRFFRKFAGQNQFRQHVGTTYVAIDGDDQDDHILGYATVASGSIEFDSLPKRLKKKLPHYPLPIVRLARLAADENARGKGVGKALLRRVFALAHEQKNKTGCIGVVVDAKDDAVEYYRRFGFFELEVLEGESREKPRRRVMFLEIGAIPHE